MNIRELIRENILLFDGAMGSELAKRGLRSGDCPEVLNVENPDLIKTVHKEYINSGAMVITTNTFGANDIKLKHTGYKTEEIIENAVYNAKSAIDGKEVLIALDIGPIGKLLEPSGSIAFEDAYDIFSKQIIKGAECGIDIILIETMTDLNEVRAAVLAAKENTNLPIFCTMSFERNARTFMGCSAESMAIILEGLGVDAIGINCSIGPKEMLPIINKVIEYSNLPIMVQPNAGLPIISDGSTIYNISDKEFKEEIVKFINKGVNIVGGCCGTTSEYISELANEVQKLKPIKREIKKLNFVGTASKIISLEDITVMGERLEVIEEEDFGYLVDGAFEQEEEVDILDINILTQGNDEVATIKKFLKELQGIVNTPIQITSSNPKVLEEALRIYNGKAIVNFLNNNERVLDTVLSIVKKYGAMVIGSTINKKGIAAKGQERMDIVRKIYEKAASYGIKEEDVIIDSVTLSSD